ncbi:MAG TPA: cupin domain-containing protein [Jiangellaceae bacterium]|jgi:mannose-6-phosphate isomerase-like protein (cupin superfamily)|nr:cupin domain-containing protein [Jiangellaceae bacterium]
MYHVDIAAAARSNHAFRRVLHTAGHVQLVVMTLQPGEDIGSEVHKHIDQVLAFVDGTVRADVGGETTEVGPGDVVIVGAGTQHNFTNVGSEPARLYTIYGPPDHAPDTVHLTKQDAEQDEQDVPPGSV